MNDPDLFLSEVLRSGSRQKLSQGAGTRRFSAAHASVGLSDLQHGTAAVNKMFGVMSFTDISVPTFGHMNE